MRAAPRTLAFGFFMTTLSSYAFNQALTESDLLRWTAIVCFIAAALVLAWVATEYTRERHMRIHRMRVFGAMFVSEFERPLLRRRPDQPAVKSRLRFAPTRRRLEILLAPGDGRSYPNLFDHRKNVEYDVERIAALLVNEPFIKGQPFASGPWIVVPFHFQTNRE